MLRRIPGSVRRVSASALRAAPEQVAAVSSAPKFGAHLQQPGLEASYTGLTRALNDMQETQKLKFASSKWAQPETYEGTRKDANEAITLPGAVYQSEDFFNIEKEHIFSNSWVSVCHVSQVPEHGALFPVKVGGSPIFIANDKGTIRAFRNVCRHRGATLCHKPCKQNVIVCPYHRWGYALDGRLMGTPLFDDGTDKSLKSTSHYSEDVRKAYDTSHVKDFDRSKMGLFKVPVDVWQGLVFVNLNGNAPPLLEYLGDLPKLIENYPLDTLVPVMQADITPKANWKALIENFLEYYHLPSVHPELCNVSGVNEHVRCQGVGMYCAFKTAPLSDATAKGQGGTALDPSRMPMLKGLDKTEARTAYHIAIFPNTFFSIYPHSMFQVNLEPLSPESSKETATLYVNPAAADADWAKSHEDMWNFWQNVNNEDIEIVERVQEGTKTPQYTGGKFSFRFEEPLHRFQNMIADYMIGQPRIPEGDSEEPSEAAADPKP